MKPSTLLLSLILPFLPLSSYAATETESRQEVATNLSNQRATFILRFDPASLKAFLEAEKANPSNPFIAELMRDEYLDTALRDAVIALLNYRTAILHMLHPDAHIDDKNVEHTKEGMVRIRFSGSMTEHAAQLCLMALEPPSLELVRLHPDNDALLADRTDSGEVRHIPEGYRLVDGIHSQFLVETPEAAQKYGRRLTENDIRDSGPCFLWNGFYIGLTPDSVPKLDKLIQETKKDRVAIILNNYVLAVPKVQKLPDGFIYVPGSSLNREMYLLQALYAPRYRHANLLRFTVEQEPVLSTIHDETAIFTWDGKPSPGEQTSSFVLKIADDDSSHNPRQEDAIRWVKLRLSFDSDLQDNVAVQPEGRDSLRVLLRRDSAERADEYRATLLDRPLVVLLRVHPDNSALLSDTDAQGNPRSLPEGYCVMDHSFTDEDGKLHSSPLVVETPEHAEKSGLLVTNEHIADARQDYQRWGHINVTLSEGGAQIMRRLTQTMERGRDRLAVVCLGRISSAPVVQDVLHKEFSISGLDGMHEAQRLAGLIRLGHIRFTSEPGK